MSEVDLSVVVPVFDNASTLDELIDRLTGAIDPLGLTYEIVMVDDGSTDASLELLRGRAARDLRIRPVALARNFGSQAALCAGFDHIRGRLVVTLDADLQNPPEDLPALLAPLERGYDHVCGVRQRRRDPWLTRRLPSALLNAYVSRRLGMPARDIGTGMRAMQAHVVRDLASEGERRRLLGPLLLERSRAVTEVPVGHCARPAGSPSGRSLVSLLGMATDYLLLSAERPFLWTGLGAVVAGGTGLLVLVAAAATLSGNLGLAGLVLVTAGFVGGVASLAGESLQSMLRQARGLPFYELCKDAEPDTPRAPRPGP